MYVCAGMEQAVAAAADKQSPERGRQSEITFLLSAHHPDGDWILRYRSSGKCFVEITRRGGRGAMDMCGVQLKVQRRSPLEQQHFFEGTLLCIAWKEMTPERSGSHQDNTRTYSVGKLLRQLRNGLSSIDWKIWFVSHNDNNENSTLTTTIAVAVLYVVVGRQGNFSKIPGKVLS